MFPVVEVSGVLMSEWASTHTTLSCPTAAEWPWMDPIARLMSMWWTTERIQWCIIQKVAGLIVHLESRPALDSRHLDQQDITPCSSHVTDTKLLSNLSCMNVKKHSDSCFYTWALTGLSDGRSITHLCVLLVDDWQTVMCPSWLETKVNNRPFKYLQH